MQPRLPFDQASICESTLAGTMPYTITLRESVSGEAWTLELDAALGGTLAGYVRQQQAAGQPYGRQAVVDILMG